MKTSKQLFKRYLSMIMAVAFSFAIVSCGDDDEESTPPAPTLPSTTYDLAEIGGSGVSGTAKFEKVDDQTTKVTLELTGTPTDGDHPAHIHIDNAATGGGIAISLTNVDGNTGMSETTVTAEDDDTAITYEELIDFDGYINVHLAPDNLGTIVAQGDIGSNALTGESKSYTLNEFDNSGILGTVLFEERVNGEALATISLQNTPAGGSHPAHIHENDAATGGPIYFSFNSVDGTSGMSKTNVATSDGGDDFGYADVLVVNGYVNVHLADTALSTIVAQGDIGANDQ